MKEVIDDSETPSGFEPRSFAGIGMTCKLVSRYPSMASPSGEKRYPT